MLDSRRDTEHETLFWRLADVDCGAMAGATGLVPRTAGFVAAGSGSAVAATPDAPRRVGAGFAGRGAC